MVYYKINDRLNKLNFSSRFYVKPTRKSRLSWDFFKLNIFSYSNSYIMNNHKIGGRNLLLKFNIN